MATVRTDVFLVSEILHTTGDACARPHTEIENQNVNQIFAKNHEKDLYLLTRKSREQIQSNTQWLMVWIQPMFRRRLDKTDILRESEGIR